MSSKPLKILVCGDVEGRFRQLFTRVNNVNRKAGPFEMLLCVGEFFGAEEEEWRKYENGEEKAPIPTYILGPNRPENMKYIKDVNGCELCENITYLGKKGIFSGASGLQIGYLSGTEQTHAAVQEPNNFSKADIDALAVPLIADSKFKGLDVLLTSPWPQGVFKYSNTLEGLNPETTGSSLIADLALAVRPRYHFAAQEGAFYERLPYRNHKVLNESTKHVTRFLGLAKVGNPEKKKYLYAFNIVPMKSMEKEELVKQPQDVTECPYSWSGTRLEQKPEADMSNQYFFSQNSGGRGRGQKRSRGQHHGGPDRKKRPQPTGPCWFCLGSPEVEKHLVVSVGTSTYMALAKGGLIPDHVLVLPIGHYQSIVDLPEDVIEELEQYKSALRRYFKSIGKTCVIFERNFRTQHLQLQVIPINRTVCDDIKEVFTSRAEEQKLELFEIPKHTDLKQVVSVGNPYFYVELDGGVKLLHQIKRNFFPLQFGREVMASEDLLDMPDRANWKACSMEKEEEARLAQEFRKKFAPFDFNDE
ncbi:CWF19-like protein 1 [Patiria miniata]|uniref:CWF19-like protein 1 n=1 Tax=Patiria miniata TaxID=46514 RepID=A0A913ZQ22_PATMI|nr:CWF19-like protein 1 [Patiria miniata]